MHFPPWEQYINYCLPSYCEFTCTVHVHHGSTLASYTVALSNIHVQGALLVNMFTLYTNTLSCKRGNYNSQQMNCLQVFARPSLILLGHSLRNQCHFLHQMIVHTVPTIFMTTTTIQCIYTHIQSKIYTGCVLWPCMFFLQATHKGDVLFALGVIQHIAGMMG